MTTENTDRTSVRRGPAMVDRGGPTVAKYDHNCGHWL